MFTFRFDQFVSKLKSYTRVNSSKTSLHVHKYCTFIELLIYSVLL